MALLLVCGGGVSFRGARNVFVALNISFGLRLRVPSHATVLVWMKKQGIVNFKEKAFFGQEKWVLVVDESMQFGSKKLLVVLAIKETDIKPGRAVGYKDLTPLVIKASASWKADEIKSEIEACIDLGQVSYAVSDNGNNLVGCHGLVGRPHIEDVGHKFSWFIKGVFEKDTVFESYTKHLSGVRGKMALSSFSHLIPPSQRIMSRFMNLAPLFDWGSKMLKIIDMGLLGAEEMEKVGCVPEYRSFILQTSHLLDVLKSVQQVLKTEHLCQATAEKCITMLGGITDARGAKVAGMVTGYLEQTLQKMPAAKLLLCSSDIIESCFGKYKEVVKCNKSVGITDLCLAISCLTSTHSQDNVKVAMETVKVKDVTKWRDKNIGESLLSKRNKLFKKVGGGENSKK